jgi:hypothetical protein
MSNQFIKVHDQLPVFEIDLGKEMILYTPGYFIKIAAIPPDELIQLLKDPRFAKDNIDRDKVFNLLRKSREAVNKYLLPRSALLSMLEVIATWIVPIVTRKLVKQGMIRSLDFRRWILLNHYAGLLQIK